MAQLAKIAEALEQPGLDALDIRELEANRLLATVALERAERTLQTVEPVPLSSVDPSVVEPVPDAEPVAEPTVSPKMRCPPVSRYGEPHTEAEKAWIEAGGTITRRFGTIAA